MSALYSIEEKIDQATATFMERMAAFSSEKVPVDLSEWFQFYAFDSIGNLTVYAHMKNYLLFLLTIL